MATIEITREEVVIRMHGWDKLLAFKSSLAVPLKHIANLVVRPADARGEGVIHAVKVAGGYIPKVLQTGYFWATGGLDGGTKHALAALSGADKALRDWERGHAHRERALVQLASAQKEVNEAIAEEGISVDEETGWVFYDVHDPDRTIGFDVLNQKLRRVVVEVDDETPEEAIAKIAGALAPASPYR